jgi:hypothetical protein
MDNASRLIRKLIRLKKSGAPDFFKKWGELRYRLSLTHEYVSFKSAVKSRANYSCEKCGRPGRHVHHIITVYENPNLVLDDNNGMFLCVRCHRKEHKTSNAHKSRKAHRCRRHTTPEKRKPQRSMKRDEVPFHSGASGRGAHSLPRKLNKK